MKHHIFVFGLFFIGVILIAACGTQEHIHVGEGERLPASVYPETRFAVISDLHFYDTQLGVEGEAFREYMDKDRKLLVQSDEIIGAAIKEIAAGPESFVLVAGDLTKDGEMVCHKGAAAQLQLLKDAGKKVFVVPGNHDVNNPESVRYTLNGTAPEPEAGMDDFKEIYKPFGYAAAIDQDPSSLSYLAEPVPGLLLLALDSNRYRDNLPGHHPIIGGAFSDETLSWVRSQLENARKSGKAVMVLQHHGIMEHYPANDKFYDQYLLEDHEKFAALLAKYGVQLVFTGHFHAQDITFKEFEAGRGAIHRIFDIETGSLVTAPCPYRTVQIKKSVRGISRASIKSHFVTAIPSMGENFAASAQEFVFEGTRRLANQSLSKYYVSEDQHDLINTQVAAAYTAHLNGDEKKPETVLDREGFGLWLRFVAWMQEDLIDGWWTDLPPEDNDLLIELTSD